MAMGASERTDAPAPPGPAQRRPNILLLFVDQMRFDEQGRVSDFGVAGAELDSVIDAGVAFRTSGCPGKFADDISACDRPYGDSPPSDIASYPFAPARGDIRKIRRQLRIVERK